MKKRYQGDDRNRDDDLGISYGDEDVESEEDGLEESGEKGIGMEMETDDENNEEE